MPRFAFSRLSEFAVGGVFPPIYQILAVSVDIILSKHLA
jgi:hypothetical protein